MRLRAWHVIAVGLALASAAGVVLTSAIARWLDGEPYQEQPFK